MTKNIAILSTVVNFGLYQKTSTLFPQGIPKYVIDGRNGMHGIDSIIYMFKKLKAKNIDWLIMADEDVLFINPNLVFGCIERMDKDGISVCGVRDGGVIPHRKYNPNAVNTFFSILNFSDVLSIWNEKEMLKNQYSLSGEFNDNLNALTSVYDTQSIFEPYYCFYLWLRRNNKKILFLPAEVPFEDDKITNLVKDELGNELLYHTWYARSYGANEKHTSRINKVLKKVKFDHEESSPPEIFKDKTYAFRKKLMKTYQRILNKANSIIK